MKNVYLYFRWEDLHGEIGEDSFDLLKMSYSDLNINQLVDLIKKLVYEEHEDVAAKFSIFIAEKPLLYNWQHAVYKGVAGSIDYKDMLLSLAIGLELSNSLDHIQNIFSLAKCLREFDREISDRFTKDIAEEVYYTFKHGE
ncbi:hypothetical protein MOF11_13360 [Bacillus haynesii]|uniref:hypothetical protein n=1 Tax=Bacillus haynesii TaxID=1925021 RepID=UPI0022831724|nr:hypothetical protein [Bacillus haynesii]MCY9226012.1 hypothetical protein [Bacillus haynesii]